MSRAMITLNRADDTARALRWIAQAPKGTRIEMKAPRRSPEANALMWCRLTEISRKVDWYGQKLTPEDWKDVFSASLRKARVVPGIDRGTFVALGLRTSDMTKEEMANLLDLMDAFAAERGVTFNEVAEAA